MTFGRLVPNLRDMVIPTATSAEPRRWQDVRQARGLSLRELGNLVGRTHSTMLAYSCGAKPVPQRILDRLAEALGEPVR